MVMWKHPLSSRQNRIEVMKRIVFQFTMRFLLIALFLTVSCPAETITGRVVGVHDGDTLTLLTPDKQQVKVRLYGIDAPETKQAFGSRAKQALSDLAFGKEAKLDIKNKDRYGRSVAWVYVGSLNANEEMVRQGMAWWYRDYAKKDAKLGELQAEAQKAKRGLWADKEPVPPWEWRKQKSPAR